MAMLIAWLWFAIGGTHLASPEKSMHLLADINPLTSGAVFYAAVAGVFATVNLPSVAVWAAGGQALRGWLQTPARLRAFNWTMAGLLVLSLWPVVTLKL